VHDHRFLVVRALYFRDIGAPPGDFHQLRCWIVIQLQYVPTGEWQRIARSARSPRRAWNGAGKPCPEITPTMPAGTA